MKRILSLLVVIAMMISMTAITVSADSAAYYKVAYTDANGTAVDPTKLAVDDTVHVRITLNGITSVIAGEIKMNWDNDVITPLDYLGNESLVFGDIWYATIADETAVSGRNGKTPVLSEDTEVNAGYLRYTTYKTGDAIAIDDGIVYLDIEFKVKKTGNAGVNVTAAQVKEVEGAFSDVSSSTVQADLVIGSTAPTFQVLGYETDLAYDGVSTGFQFVAERTDADVTVASDVVTLPSVENLGNVKLGLNIENIPADKTLDDIKAVLNVFARWVK